ncbi:hypothetical protein GCM10010344_63510 [Streptomyces bluensis]|nr:hypothetical protein GCM10010344_63510 [Streptomyces bluensis]
MSSPPRPGGQQDNPGLPEPKMAALSPPTATSRALCKQPPHPTYTPPNALPARFLTSTDWAATQLAP